MYTPANTAVTAAFTTIDTAASIATCRAKSSEMKISRTIWTYRLPRGHISNFIAMANCIKLKLPGLDARDVLLTKRQYGNTTAASSATTIQYYY